MNSTLATSFLHVKTSSSVLHLPSLKPQYKPKPLSPLRIVSATSSSSSSSSVPTRKHSPMLSNLSALAKTAIMIGVTASMAWPLSLIPPAKAETREASAEQTATTLEEEVEGAEEETENPLADLLDSNAEAIESLKLLLQKKLDSGEDEAALKILQRLVSAQPTVTDWKFLLARLFNEMGQVQNARQVFEEILAANPLSFEALFENALLMDRCGEGEAVIGRLQQALDVAEEEHKVREARDVRLIMAQIHFLQKNVEEALKSYQDLSKEDPGDFRPYFCRGMIYTLLDRNEEAKEQFAKYRQLSPKKFEVEGYLRTPLSKMKVFGSNEKN